MKSYLMKSYLYSPYELARMILQHQMDIIRATEFLHQVHQHDRPFIEACYRQDEKKFMLDVMNQMDDIQYRKQLNTEKKAIEQDFRDLGLTGEESDSPDVTYHYAFKELRLRIVYIQQKNYVRLKMRNFMKALNHKRRSESILHYIFNCLFFYHISVSLSGNTPCDLREVAMDDILIFKII